jgi:hypothetical protein
MEDDSIPPNGNSPAPPAQALPGPVLEAQPSPEELRRQRQIVIGAAIGGLIFLVLAILAIYVLTLPSTDTAKIRDIFIIVMALESLVIGLSLVILMVQLARLINLLQNEIKPILDSTQKTVNNLRGTTAFLSENMVEPVIKLNEYLAALRTMLENLRFFRRE